MFVSPSNPTGAVYPPDEVEAIGRWALEHGIWVVTDEIYEHLTFGEHRFTSMPRARARARRHAASILNGVAKTYAMTGWRVGWMIGPADVVKAATNLQSHSTSNVANVSQRGRARRGQRSDLDAVAEMRAAFDRRAEHRPPHAQRHRRRHLPRARGRVLRLPEPHGLLGRDHPGPQGGDHDRAGRAAARRGKVAIVPGEAFGAPGYARLSFALGDDDLGEGLTRIADAVAAG